MRSRPVLALGLAFLAGVGAIAVKAERTLRASWDSLHVAASGAVADVPAGAVACESPVWPEKPFSWVSVAAAPPGAAAPQAAAGAQLQVAVRDFRTQRLLAAASASAAAPGGRSRAELGRELPADAPVAICLENRGAPVALWGVPAVAEAADDPTIGGTVLTQSDATVGGTRVGGDFSIEMGRGPQRTRSLLATVPDAFARAALFKAPFVGAWTFWVLLGAFLIGAPLALGRALVLAGREDDA